MVEGLVTTIASLALICALAIGALRLLARRPARGAIRLRGALALEAKRSVYVVEAGGRCFLVGGSEGAMALIAELDPASLPAESEAAPSALKLALRRVLT
jgi:flagellar biogenesis protein FliO